MMEKKKERLACFSVLTDGHALVDSGRIGDFTSNRHFCRISSSSRIVQALDSVGKFLQILCESKKTLYDV